MFMLIVAAMQIAVLPPAPVPPPPYSRKLAGVIQRKQERISMEYKRCGDAIAYNHKYSLEAYGTDRFSPEWKKATDAVNNALTTCKSARRALREKMDFLVDIVQRGNPSDGDLAAVEIGVIWFELQPIEEFFASYPRQYRQLLKEGWGSPHCLEHNDGYMPASAICPQVSSKPLL